jgi:WD40 repeat protein
MSMRRKLVDVEWDNPNRRDHETGYLFGARFSKDDYRSVIFACGAGKNEAKCFDNDTDGNGKYRELSHVSDNSAAVLCCDTSPNGKQVAMGTGSGKVFITPYSINKKGEEEDEM